MHYKVENYLWKEGVKGELDKTGYSGKTNANLWAEGDGSSPSRSTTDLLQTLEANRSFCMLQCSHLQNAGES